jgi:hypothetical protein
MNKIVFFNFFHNGDCFVTKEYVRDIISKLPGIEFEYAHNNHENIICDLDCKHVPIVTMPDQFDLTYYGMSGQAAPIPYYMPMLVDTLTSTVYINTWVGSFQDLPKWGRHANFTTLPHMWKEVYDYLKIPMIGDYTCYHPEIRFDRCNTSHAQEYLSSIGDAPLVVFCNNNVMSRQSSMGNMEKIIDNISSQFPDHQFLVTDRVDVHKSNVQYSEDVLKGMVGNLNQISFITHVAKLIIGKNSGPFSYAHTRSNMTNPHKTFMCFSKQITECLTGGGEYLANSYFSDTTDDIVASDIISKLISNPIRNSVARPIQHMS